MARRVLMEPVMAKTKTKPSTPYLAVISVHELRRMFKQVRTTGKLPPSARTGSTRLAGRRAA